MVIEQALLIKSKFSVLIIAASLALLSVAGHFVYKNQREKAQLQAYHEMTCIAALKSAQITYWYNKIHSESAFLSESTMFPQEISKWINRNHWDTLHFLSHVDLAIKNGDYSNLVVTDQHANIIYTHKGSIKPDDRLLDFIHKAIQSKKTVSADFYMNPDSSELRMDIVEPVIDNGKVVATISFRIDLSAFYIPIITAWPITGNTAEIVIVRSDGDSMTVTRCPSAKDVKPIVRKLPKNLDIPIAHALAGKRGMHRGVDFYGKQVLSDLRKIEGTPWFMVTKLDEKEIMKEFNAVALLNFMVISLIIIVVIGVVFSIRRSKEKAYLLKHQNQLNIAKEKAEESDHLKSVFLANLSHEIRTPMNGIMGFLHLLADRDTDEELRNEYMELMMVSGQRLLDTINDIIEISKIEVGETIVKNSVLNMNEMIRFHYNFFKIQTEEKNLKLVIGSTLDSGHEQIISDKQKINSIFTNMLRNAIKFTEQGHVEFGVLLENSNMVIYFKDTGIGIPLSKREMIFDRFVQADNKFTRKYEGSGLGLSIVKAYTEAMGGTIDVFSEEGRGSIFKITLPYVEAPVLV